MGAGFRVEAGLDSRRLAAAPWSVPESLQFQAEEEYLTELYRKAIDVLFDTGYQVSESRYRQLKLAVENALIDLEVAQMQHQLHQGHAAGPAEQPE